MTDRNGIRKDRTAAIITQTSEISEERPFVVVAISKRKEADDDVEVPWKRGGHPKTGLYEPCFAIVSWIQAVNLEDVRHKTGTLPASQLKRILENVNVRLATIKDKSIGQKDSPPS